MATFQDGNRRRATANTVTAMKRSATSRQCSACGRKSAMQFHSDDFGFGSTCRWCGHSTYQAREESGQQHDPSCPCMGRGWFEDHYCDEDCHYGECVGCHKRRVPCTYQGRKVSSESVTYPCACKTPDDLDGCMEMVATPDTLCDLCGDCRQPEGREKVSDDQVSP